MTDPKQQGGKGKCRDVGKYQAYQANPTTQAAILQNFKASDLASVFFNGGTLLDHPAPHWARFAELGNWRAPSTISVQATLSLQPLGVTARPQK